MNPEESDSDDVMAFRLLLGTKNAPAAAAAAPAEPARPSLLDGLFDDDDARAPVDATRRRSAAKGAMVLARLAAASDKDIDATVAAERPPPPPKRVAPARQRVASHKPLAVGPSAGDAQRLYDDEGPSTDSSSDGSSSYASSSSNRGSSDSGSGSDSAVSPQHPRQRHAARATPRPVSRPGPAASASRPPASTRYPRSSLRGAEPPHTEDEVRRLAQQVAVSRGILERHAQQVAAGGAQQQGNAGAVPLAVRQEWTTLRGIYDQLRILSGDRSGAPRF